MKSFVVGCLIVLCAIPLDAHGSCRKRFRNVVRVEKVVVREVAKFVQPQVVNNYYYPPERAVVYNAPPLVQVQTAALQPAYVEQRYVQQQAVAVQQAAVCCVPCPCPPTQLVPSMPAPPQHPVPAPDGQPPVGEPPTPPAAGSGDQDIQALFNKTCVSCHDGSNPKTTFLLTDLSKLSREQRQATSIRVMLGEMPPGRPEDVSDAEAQSLLKWSNRK